MTAICGLCANPIDESFDLEFCEPCLEKKIVELSQRRHGPATITNITERRAAGKAGDAPTRWSPATPATSPSYMPHRDPKCVARAPTHEEVARVMRTLEQMANAGVIAHARQMFDALAQANAMHRSLGALTEHAPVVVDWDKIAKDALAAARAWARIEHDHEIPTTEVAVAIATDVISRLVDMGLATDGEMFGRYLPSMIQERGRGGPLVPVR